MAAASPIRACPHCGTRNRLPAAATGRPRCATCHRDLPWIVDASDDSFAEVAEQARPLVIVDLWAPWCQPCHVLAPMLEEIAIELAGHLKVVKVNIDESPRIGARLDARSIPTMVLMRQGQQLDRRVGVTAKSDLRAWIDGHLEPTGAS